MVRIFRVIAGKYYQHSSFFGIPQKQMTVLLDTSSKDPLHSLMYIMRSSIIIEKELHILYVNDLLMQILVICEPPLT